MPDADPGTGSGAPAAATPPSSPSTSRGERAVLRRIARNGAWLFGEHALRAGVGAAVGAIVARHLGPAAYGTLAVVFSYLALFTAAAGLGLPSVVARDIVRCERERGVILGSALAIRAVSMLVVIAAGLLVVWAIEGTDTGVLLLASVAAGALVFQLGEVIDFGFQADLRGRESATARSAGFMVASLARLVFVAAGAPLLFFAATPVLDAAVAALLFVLLAARRPRSGQRWRPERARAIRLLRDAAPVAISSFVVIGIMQVDRLLLDALSGPGAVGVYAAASLLSGAWYAVPAIIGASVAPVLTRLHAENPDAYRHRLADVLGAVTALSLAVGACGALLSGPIIRLLFGADFAGAAPVLAIHIWTGVFVSHASIRTRALMIEGGERSILRLSVFTLAATIGLDLLLIPAWAEIGAALASLAAWAIGTTILPLFDRRTRHFVPQFLRSALPAAWWRWARSSNGTA